MINLTHMIYILNYVFTIVFYTMRWTKLDITCMCFEEFINQLNLLYIYIYLYLQQNTSYDTHELGRESIFFVKPSLAQWAESEFFIPFYVFNIDVVFYAPLICVYFVLKRLIIIL
jgi:hypothetical protein